MLWYTREASVAVYVANLPGIWPLLREHIRILRDHTNSYVTGSKPQKYGYGSKYGSQYGQMSSKSGVRSRIRTVNGEADSDEIELGLGHNYAASNITEEKSKRAKDPFNPVMTVRSSKTSLDSDERALHDTMGTWKTMGVVQVDTKVEIQRNSWDVRDRDGPQTEVKIEGPQGEVDKKP